MTHHKLHSSRLAAFPALTRHNHRITSDASDEYNCFAWAAGETTNWWDPADGYYWPLTVASNADDVQSFAAAFATKGYVVCEDGALERGIEKIAIYVHATDGPTHAALQLPNGKWTSKLGVWEDIEHDSEHDLEGALPNSYGEVHTYMQRPRAT